MQACCRDCQQPSNCLPAHQVGQDLDHLAIGAIHLELNLHFGQKQAGTRFVRRLQPNHTGGQSCLATQEFSAKCAYSAAATLQRYCMLK